jgi:hypothetical protein
MFKMAHARALAATQAQTALQGEVPCSHSLISTTLVSLPPLSQRTRAHTVCAARLRAKNQFPPVSLCVVYSRSGSLLSLYVIADSAPAHVTRNEVGGALLSFTLGRMLRV